VFASSQAEFRVGKERRTASRAAAAIPKQASQVSADSGKAVPGVAQGALQMGAFVARIIDAEARGTSRERPAFRYKDKGSMATIGKDHAVADIGSHHFGGVLAWLMWGAVHVLFLVSFRNRVFVLLSWLYTYFVHARGARLITETEGPRVKSSGIASSLKPRAELERHGAIATTQE